MQFPRPLAILILGLIAVVIALFNWPRMVLARRSLTPMQKFMRESMIRRVK